MQCEDSTIQQVGVKILAKQGITNNGTAPKVAKGNSKFAGKMHDDDDDDDDNVEIHTFPNANFRLHRRFRPDRVIGYGSYGVVCAATDSVSQRRIAIKKISNPFVNPDLAKRTLRELRFLKHFHSHRNIISVLTILKPPSDLSKFRDIYVVMELQETNLHRIIHSKQALSEEHVRYFMFQLLSGLQFIHASGVLHRDIKPGNLLINSNCSLKICDFGMARALASTPEEHSGFMTAYVATRWYRAPEVMLSFYKYTQAIDVWSVACVLGEMLGRRYLFPGRDYIHQLLLILTLLGSPTKIVISKIGSDPARQYVASLPHLDPIPLQDVYKDASDTVLNLMEKMLKFDPDERISVQDALYHPFFAKYHHQIPQYLPNVPRFDFEFELPSPMYDIAQHLYQNCTTSPEQIRELVIDEVMQYHTPGTTAYQNARYALAKRSVVCTSLDHGPFHNTATAQRSVADSAKRSHPRTSTRNILRSKLAPQSTSRPSSFPSPQQSQQETHHQSNNQQQLDAIKQICEPKRRYAVQPQPQPQQQPEEVGSQQKAQPPPPKKTKRRTRPLNKILHPEPTPETQASLAEFRSKFRLGSKIPDNSTSNSSTSLSSTASTNSTTAMPANQTSMSHYVSTVRSRDSQPGAASSPSQFEQQVQQGQQSAVTSSCQSIYKPVSPANAFSPIVDPGELGSPVMPSARAIEELTNDFFGLDGTVEWPTSALDAAAIDADTLLYELTHGSAAIFGVEGIQNHFEDTQRQESNK
eukprot:gene10530-2658_t